PSRLQLPNANRLCADYLLFLRQNPPPGIYPLSLHRRSSDLSRTARSTSTSITRWMPPCKSRPRFRWRAGPHFGRAFSNTPDSFRDRKSTRLNSSHRTISYAVFCLKKKTATEPNVAKFEGLQI